MISNAPHTHLALKTKGWCVISHLWLEVETTIIVYLPRWETKVRQQGSRLKSSLQFLSVFLLAWQTRLVCLISVPAKAREPYVRGALRPESAHNVELLSL
jgi:hypothetical protein